MFYIRMGAEAIIGASPKCSFGQGRHVETHPIAGTRRRGATAEEDQQLGENSPKREGAGEHVMLVDLANDIGRVAEVGSVRVPQFMTSSGTARHAPGIAREGRSDDAVGSTRWSRPAGRHATGAQDSGHADHRRTRADAPGLAAGRWGTSTLPASPFLHRDSPITMKGRRAGVQAGAGIVADGPAAE
jgi:anthranilate synthase component 1